ncbi:uncharacterized protein EV420DRAFT_1626957 [Desarmillaria tabescens]|uniref:Transmembrane protein 135 N-terminal domain-containing protein n=1 Tax=Armillaria tabescens TaxID=1929756 RepID=A0AA39NG68_ARMTA|nr:uncharacterized protein EV420DRAFT_1626957 [Desarmillaria tabescens]KAK0465020.1 hypothetical protein EV420DRAFT_1626957 [Desarmillaria tabescens]
MTAKESRLSLNNFFSNPTHQITLRTYALAISLSLGPALTPFVSSLFRSKQSSKYNKKALKALLRQELGFGGFAFAITLAVGAGATVRHLWTGFDEIDSKYTKIAKEKLAYSNLTSAQKTFISYALSSAIGIHLLQKGRRRSNAQNSMPSRTLDLTLLLFVRAVDAPVQSFVYKRSSRVRVRERSVDVEHRPDLLRQRLLREKHQTTRGDIRGLTARIDALVFWACSARIMWCFFYQPERLPRSYVKWINALANVDARLLRALRLIYEGKWSYTRGYISSPAILETYANDLGYPAAWGSPSALPSIGGQKADIIWNKLGVTSRPGVGGLPCELVHGGVGSQIGLAGNCTANAGLRAVKALAQSMAIYLPVHFFPVLLTRPTSLLRPHRVVATFLSAFRSASFLTAFIASYWYAVCLTRSLFLARAFSFVSHDFWDGPYGCILAGCLSCGSSIWIENGRRRGEMTLYVLPRAIRTILPDKWIRSGNRGVLAAERLAFVLSLSSLVTTAIHRTDSLRGLSRWTLAFIMNGPDTGFWKGRRSFDPSIPTTPDSLVSDVER